MTGSLRYGFVSDQLGPRHTRYLSSLYKKDVDYKGHQTIGTLKLQTFIRMKDKLQ